MTHEEIIVKLRHTMKQSSEADVDWDALTGDSAIDSLGFDSLSILDLIYDIQQEFGVEFEATDMATIKTVTALAAFLEEKGA